MTQKAESSTRNSLSSELIINVATRIADEQGIVSLSMRNLAKALDVEAMSIYHYFKGKDDILEGILEQAIDEIDFAPEVNEWRERARSIGLSIHLVTRNHPWVATLWTGLLSPGPKRLRYMETLLGVFRSGGFTPELTHHAFHTFENHVFGFALQAANFPFDAEQLVTVGREFLASLPSEEFPYLIEHVEGHLRESGVDTVSDFEFGLDLILDGLDKATDSRRE